MKCNTCQNERYCYDGNHQLTRDGCADNGFAAYAPLTNADRIRAMSGEELARFIAGQRGWYCDFKDPEEEEYPKVLDWLKAPVEEGKHD